MEPQPKKKKKKSHETCINLLLWKPNTSQVYTDKSLHVSESCAS